MLCDYCQKEIASKRDAVPLFVAEVVYRGLPVFEVRHRACAIDKSSIERAGENPVFFQGLSFFGKPLRSAFVSTRHKALLTSHLVLLALTLLGCVAIGTYAIILRKYVGLIAWLIFIPLFLHVRASIKKYQQYRAFH